MNQEHDSDCATHNAPALAAAPCDCSLNAPAGLDTPAQAQSGGEVNTPAARQS